MGCVKGGLGASPRLAGPRALRRRKNKVCREAEKPKQEKKGTCLYWLTFSRVSENGNGCNAVRRTVCLGISFGSLARHIPNSGCAGLRRRSSCPLVSERLRKCERKGNCVLGSQSLLQSLRHCCMLCLRLFFLKLRAPAREARRPAPRPPRRGRGAFSAVGAPHLRRPAPPLRRSWPPSRPLAFGGGSGPWACAARSNSPEGPCGAEVGGCSRFFYSKAKQARSARPCYKKSRSPFLFSSALVLAGAAAGQYDSTPPRPARPAGSLPAFRGAPLSARPGVRAARPCVAPPPPSRYSRRAGRRASRLRALGLRAAQF